MEDRNKPKPRKQKYTILTLLFYQKKRIIRRVKQMQTYYSGANYYT